MKIITKHWHLKFQTLPYEKVFVKIRTNRSKKRIFEDLKEQLKANAENKVNTLNNMEYA